MNILLDDQLFETVHFIGVRSERAFPRILDTDHPEFFPRLERCAIANQRLAEIASSERSGVIKFVQKLPWIAVILWQLLRLYLLPSIDAEATRATVR